MEIRRLRTVAAAAAVAVIGLAGLTLAAADTVGPITFEAPTYHVGSIDGQDGWTSAGAAGHGCARYDHAVVNNASPGLLYHYPTFGGQSLRISDAVTSGCFSDQTFAKPLVNGVGETSATASTFPPGVRQRHFEMEFEIASTVPGAQQPGLHISVSPDRGDGSRMSYLRFEDGPTGLDVFFDDVQGTFNGGTPDCPASTPIGGKCANFVETKIATGLKRSVPHQIRLTLDTKDGPSNDVVKVYIDGKKVHKGTSWEDYYRYDSEASAEQSPRIVKTILFRSGGDPTPADLGKGFLFDRVSLRSGDAGDDRSDDRDDGHAEDAGGHDGHGGHGHD